MAIFSDPQGDAFGSDPLRPDLESVSGVVVNDDLILTLDFYNSITVPLAINGTIDLDTDQNVLTGRPSLQSTSASPEQSGGPMGVDVRVSFRGSMATLDYVADPDNTVQLGSIPIVYSADQIAATIPLVLLSNYLGNTQAINFSAIVGSNSPLSSDAAPNTQVATVTEIPAPPLQIGTAGDDQLTGTEGRDSISGLEGNDIIRGLGAADWLRGDQGNDRVEAGIGNDLSQGGEGDDQILGDQGDDQILGEAGNDKLNGGQGKDLVFGGQGKDQILEVTQRPRLAPREEDILNGEGGNDTIDGGIDDDTISGGSGRDRLTGGIGFDKINGDAGNDILIGVNPRIRDDASDTLTGGTGKDRFILGDNRRIYYVDIFKGDTRLFDRAIVTDFRVGQDTIQVINLRQSRRLERAAQSGLPLVG